MAQNFQKIQSCQETPSSAPKQNYFDLLDSHLIKHIFVEYIDCYSLVSLAETCVTFYDLISGEGGVTDELLYRISPLLTTYHNPHKFVPLYKFDQRGGKLHAVHFYEEVRRAKRKFMVSCGEDHTIVVANIKPSQTVASSKISRSNSAYNSKYIPTYNNELTQQRLLSFGSNKYGQLGVNDKSESDVESLQEVILPDADLIMNKTKFKSVVGGANHTLVLLENGKLYGFGDNSEGQLGPHVPSEKCYVPYDLKFPKVNVSMFSCAKDYSAIVLADSVGTVLILGNGLPCATEPYVHNGKETAFRSLSRGVINVSEKVTEVSAGYGHLLIITKGGKPYSVGKNNHGQLGALGVEASDNSLVLEPVEVDFDYKVNPVAQVAAGESHSMLLTRDGHLYTWGDGRDGQLGLGTFSSKVTSPREVKLPSTSFPIIITCGNNHSVILDIDGQILTFGNNNFGQTGSGSPFFATNRATVVSSGEFDINKNKAKPKIHGNMKKDGNAYGDKKVREMIHIAAGKTHTAVLGKSNKLYMFGQSKYCGGSHCDLNKCSNREESADPSLIDLSLIPTIMEKTNTSSSLKGVKKDKKTNPQLFYNAKFRRNTSNGAFNYREV